MPGFWTLGPRFRLPDNNDTPQTIGKETANLIGDNVLRRLPEIITEMLKKQGIDGVVGPDGTIYDLDVKVIAIELTAQLTQAGVPC